MGAVITTCNSIASTVFLKYFLTRFLCHYNPARIGYDAAYARCRLLNGI